MDCIVASLLAMTGTGRRYPFRSFAPALPPDIGIWFTASTTAKVITSIAMPSTAIAARSPPSLRS